jgi:pSer/pThr/pTyr-binding forkhead associated (FHA) protein
VNLFVANGTWVSGRRIEPGVHVVLKEGDTVEIGGSDTVYEFHWLVRSKKQKKKKPLMLRLLGLPPLYTIKEEEGEGEEEAEDAHQVASFFLCLQGVR